jgi:hypothetical protein
MEIKRPETGVWGEVQHGCELHADLEAGTLPWTETGTILSSVRFKLRMRAAMVGACSCSAISAAASSVFLRFFFVW